MISAPSAVIPLALPPPDLEAERAAAFYTLIETANLNQLDPKAYLRDVLTRIANHPAKRLTDLLPWDWPPAQPAAHAA